jgi:LysR family transcriptional regulator, glycine cleavage system transcriptional activator
MQQGSAPSLSNRLPPLDALVTFEAAARHLSFTRAAAERFVTQSAVSRQIKSLEDSVGMPLFRRQHRALALTDEGRQLYETCRELFDRLRITINRLRSGRTRQVLTLTTTPGMASLWLIPRLARFTQRHPGVDVRVDATYDARHLDSEGIDVALRYGPVATMRGVRLFGEEVTPVCSPSLRADRGRPLKSAADLRHHTLLRMGSPVDQVPLLEWEPWFEAMGMTDLQPAATLSFTHYDEVISAALLGQGVALGRRPLIDQLLREKKLVVPFQGSMASPRAFFVLVSNAARENAAATALEQWLIEESRAPDLERHAAA